MTRNPSSPLNESVRRFIESSAWGAVIVHRVDSEGNIVNPVEYTTVTVKEDLLIIGCPCGHEYEVTPIAEVTELPCPVCKRRVRIEKIK